MKRHPIERHPIRRYPIKRYPILVAMCRVRKFSTFILLIYFNKIAWFLPRDAMRKRGLCCRPVSVRTYVCLSVTFVSYIQTDKDIVKLLSRHGSPIILVF